MSTETINGMSMKVGLFHQEVFFNKYSIEKRLMDDHFHPPT